MLWHSVPLDTLALFTALGALVGTALVYLFSQRD